MSPLLAGVRVRSARYSYPGPGRFDITRKSGGDVGKLFSPTDELLWPFLRERQRNAELLKEARGIPEGDEQIARLDEVRLLEDRLWSGFAPAFLAELRICHGGLCRSRPWKQWKAHEREAWRRGARPHPEAWEALRCHAVHTPEGLLLVFVCYCAWPFREHCHTRLVCQACAALGAEDLGEIPREEQRAAERAHRAEKKRRAEASKARVANDTQTAEEPKP
jgi:hypothetical protein